MKILLLGLLGLVLGAMAGALLGIGAGLAWTSVAHTSCFEGECGFVVFIFFMPLGAIVGALAGAIGLGYLASRRKPAAG